MQRRRAHDPHPDEELAVTCWCEATVGYLPTNIIAKGLTFSCGRKGCEDTRNGPRAAGSGGRL